jgi:hypothetical protein
VEPETIAPMGNIVVAGSDSANALARVFWQQLRQPAITDRLTSAARGWVAVACLEIRGTAVGRDGAVNNITRIKHRQMGQRHFPVPLHRRQNFINDRLTRCGAGRGNVKGGKMCHDSGCSHIYLI